MNFSYWEFILKPETGTLRSVYGEIIGCFILAEEPEMPEGLPILPHVKCSHVCMLSKASYIAFKACIWSVHASPVNYTHNLGVVGEWLPCFHLYFCFPEWSHRLLSFSHDIYICAELFSIQQLTLSLNWKIYFVLFSHAFTDFSLQKREKKVVLLGQDHSWVMK